MGGYKTGVSPAPHPPTRAPALAYHHLSDHVLQPALRGLVEQSGHVKKSEAHAHLKVQTWIRHARPLVSCSMADRPLTELIPHTTPSIDLVLYCRLSTSVVRLSCKIWIV